MKSYKTITKLAACCFAVLAMTGCTKLNEGLNGTLTNGQVVYVVESFFRTPPLGSGEFDSRGIYTRVYM